MSAAVAMARMAVADGIGHLACTPHITPGVYDNTGPDILARVQTLSHHLAALDIPLTLWGGADAHIDPGLTSALASGAVPTLAGSRYFLLEPSHHVVPPRLSELVRTTVAAGFIPLLTHPERLSWIETHYDLILGLVRQGALVQLTAGSLTGTFGKRAKYWSERMLDDGLVDVLATDAHNTSGRPPVLSRARDVAAQRLGDAEAEELVYNRPARILRNEEIPYRAKAISPQLDDKLPRGRGPGQRLLDLLRGRRSK